MIIQNNSFYEKAKIRSYLVIIGLMVFSVIILFWNDLRLDFNFTAIQKTIIVLFFIAAYVIYTIKRFSKRYFFIYFTDDDKEHLVIRFFNIRFYGKKHTTYKIPITKFVKYEIITNKGIKELVLFQQTENNKIAKYPPISISAFSDEQTESLENTLKLYIK